MSHFLLLGTVVVAAQEPPGFSVTPPAAKRSRRRSDLDRLSGNIHYEERYANETHAQSTLYWGTGGGYPTIYKAAQTDS